MKACVRADLYRIYSSKARIIFSIIIMLISMGVMLLIKSFLKNKLGYFEAGTTLTSGVVFLPLFLPIFIGIFEISQVYGVDFEARTMQVAVGIGKTRIDIILAKQLECYICLLTDVLCGYLGVLIFCLINKISVTENYSLSIISVFVAIWFNSMVYVTAASTLAFIRFGVGLATVVYVIFCVGAGPVFMSIGKALGLTPTQLDTIRRYTVSEQSSVLISRIQAKSLILSNVAFYAFSIIVWNAVAYLIIRKKELDL